MYRLLLVSGIILSFSLSACLQSNSKRPVEAANQQRAISFTDMKGETFQFISKSNDQWKAEMDDLTYHVMREKGTERAYTGQYNENKKDGVYTCNACKLPLFSSDAKFESGTGWPSFYQPIDKTHVLEETDATSGMRRVEVLCRRCSGHLGHVFDDGPQPTGLRYCMNSVSLDFIPK
ncbi:MAG: peptide-methionine (R)-S-oxide reductase MsrB [Saprospiraceae bacterium]